MEKVEKGVKQMNHRMNKDEKTWLVLVTLIAVAILAAIWATSAFWLPYSGLRHPLPYQYETPGDIELFYTVKAVFSMINVALVVSLLVIYIDIYQKTRSEFTIGLIVFSGVLLLQALTSIPLVHRAFGFGEFGLGPFAMLPDLFTCAALVVLLVLSVKY